MGISLAEYKKLTAKSEKKKHKYNAKPVVIDGIHFKSTKEGEYYNKLKFAKLSGELINFYMQVPFRLPGKTTYWLDFLEIWKNGIVKHTDTKGALTQVFLIKKRQVEEIYGITIEVV
jgi:hypothetical protein